MLNITSDYFNLWSHLPLCRRLLFLQEVRRMWHLVIDFTVNFIVKFVTFSFAIVTLFVTIYSADVTMVWAVCFPCFQRCRESPYSSCAVWFFSLAPKSFLPLTISPALPNSAHFVACFEQLWATTSWRYHINLDSSSIAQKNLLLFWWKQCQGLFLLRLQHTVMENLVEHTVFFLFLSV